MQSNGTVTSPKSAAAAARPSLGCSVSQAGTGNAAEPRGRLLSPGPSPAAAVAPAVVPVAIIISSSVQLNDIDTHFLLTNMNNIVQHVNTIWKPMRFESHFKSYFGNVKALNLKKIKIIAEPVAAMAGGGPAAGGRWQANSLGRA